MWKGRFDSEQKPDLRLWQKVKKFEPEITENSLVFTGYNTDDGVKRNLGRIGAAKGADAIRSCCSSLPYREEFGDIYDTGNTDIHNLEEAQKELAKRSASAIKQHNFPINLGGGHDIAYGSYQGLRQAYPHKKIGIINFDTHLDMRCYAKQPSSGTAFKQILDADDFVQYMIIGYQDIGNTLRLREEARQKNVVISKLNESKEQTRLKLDNIIANNDVIYVTFCMDVFDITQAPGVSAPSSMGLGKFLALDLFGYILESHKVKIVDFAEVNPSLDIDNRTARLVSNFIYRIMEYRADCI